MEVVLVMFRAEGERRSFSLTRDVTVIGRREDCDLRVPVSDVSRKHCRLVKEGDALRLDDLGSSNGTFHNGQRVQEAALQPGDSVQVGPLVFVVQIDGVPADDQLQPFADRAAQQLAAQPAPEELPAGEALEALPADAAGGLPAGAPPAEDAPVELDPADLVEGEGGVADGGQAQ